MSVVARRAGSLLLVGGIVLVGLPVAAGDVGDEGEAALVDAYEAARHHDFEAVVQVEWSDGDRYHVEQVPVRAVDGVIEVGGTRRVVGTARGHYLRDHGRWNLLWSGGDGARRPAPGAKYDLAVDAGPPVAGRPTTVVEVRHDGELRERTYLDDETGMILRREQYEHRPEAVRIVTFRDVELVAGAPRPAIPEGVEGPPDDTPDDDLPAPERVGEGWVLQGSYSLADGTVQRYYTDGVFGLSLFEQEGELDWDALPAGEPVELAGHDARRWAGPSGVVVVWELDGVVYTTVSDASTDEVAAIVDDLGDDESLFGRAVRFVLSPFLVL